MNAATHILMIFTDRRKSRKSAGCRNCRFGPGNEWPLPSLSPTLTCAVRPPPARTTHANTYIRAVGIYQTSMPGKNISPMPLRGAFAKEQPA